MGLERAKASANEVALDETPGAVGGRDVLLAGVFAAVFFSPPKEPVYQGRKLSEWLDVARGLNLPGVSRADAVTAVQAVGSNALPWLVHEAKAKDTWQTLIQLRLHRWWPGKFSKPATPHEQWPRACMGFAILGDAALPSIPDLVELLKHPNERRSAVGRMTLLSASGVDNHMTIIYRLKGTPASASHSRARSEVFNALLAVADDTNLMAGRRQALSGLASFQDEAKRSVPVLIRGLHDDERLVRLSSVSSLGRLAREPVAVIPELIGALDDPSVEVRRSATWALGQYYRQAKTAVPRLLAARRDPDPEVRRVANESLDKIDPETAAAIPDLPGFKP